MRIFDAHCDVLYKMWRNPSISFENSKELHVTLKGLRNFPKSVQCFAIYIPEDVQEEARFSTCLKMIDIFYQKIIKPYPEIKFISSKKDISSLKENEIGAMLCLEGCDAIGRDISRLKTLYRLGVTSVGLTWNYANLVADGALEERNAGLTNFGKEVISLNNANHIWTDLSHLGEKSFWEALALAKYPIASHSNCHDLFTHKRNLKKDQIKALIKKNGVIGITFVPQFLKEKKRAGLFEVINHIEYVLELGGSDHIGIGTDFDGIDQTVKNLGCTTEFYNLIDELYKNYSSNIVDKILYLNFVNHYPR